MQRARLLHRHQRGDWGDYGDWGDLDAEDMCANTPNLDLKHGGLLLSLNELEPD